MADQSDLDRVWTLMETIGVCMVSTHDGNDIRARPMAAHVERDRNAVHFLTDVSGHKDDEIAADVHVGLAFADPSGQKYVSVTGHAVVSNDRDKIRELFSMPAKAWWDSAEDPAIRVLTVTPKDAQYWDGPGTLVASAKMLAAAALGTKPSLGDSAKVRM